MVASLVVSGHAGALDRARARFWSRRLDRALAGGSPSEATPALALRARRLIALSYRRSVAETYRRIVREACRTARPARLRVKPCRSRVTAASDELLRLADSLTRPGPVAARGVAQALLLLADGTGPLYNPRSAASLRAYADRATGNLELRPAYPRP